MYDIIIIGGGIAGLYSLYKLPSQKLKVALIEKNDRLGGKLRTVYGKDGEILYESGPWRIGRHHHHMINLCKELKINLKKIEKTVNLFIPRKGSVESLHIDDIQKDPGLSVFDTFLLKDGIEKARRIQSKTGYHDILDMDSTIDAYDAKTKKETYLVIEKGFSHLIQKLADKVLDVADFLMETFVTDVDKCKKGYIVSLSQRIGPNQFIHKTVNASEIILACPPSSIQKWSVASHFEKLFSCISSYPLNHIYGLCATKPQYRGRSDFYIVTDNLLSQVVSTNYDNDWIQISYSGGRIAKFWDHLYRNHKILWKKKILRELKTILKKTDITRLKMYYWDEAIHMWIPGFHFDLESMYRLSLYPNPVSLSNLYIVGESFSKNQGWCEGALETVEDLMTIMRKNYFIKILNVSLIPYVMYKDRILNVQQWIYAHPGGEHPIHNHLGEDISLLWDSIHNTGDAQNQIMCLQVGWKYKGRFYKIR